MRHCYLLKCCRYSRNRRAAFTKSRNTNNLSIPLLCGYSSRAMRTHTIRRKKHFVNKKDCFGELRREMRSEIFKETSMHFRLPVLATFPFIGVHPCNDIYEIFRFDPMHNVFLGILKILHNCMSRMLSDVEENQGL